MLKKLLMSGVIMALAVYIAVPAALADEPTSPDLTAGDVAGLAAQSSADEFTFTTNGDEATVTGYSGTASGNLAIPATFQVGDDVYTVTAIAARAFTNQSGFTGTLSIPDTVTSIGDYAFSGCTGLTGSITLPSSLKTIGNYAFQNCLGMSGVVTIPANVTSIGDYAFYVSGYSRDMDWKGVTGVKFASGSKLQTIGAYAFSGNWYIEGGLAFPDSVTEIGEHAFLATYVSGNDKGTLTLPSGIQTIGEGAFENCGFTGDLVIPNATVVIGDEAFRSAGFTGTLTLPEGMTTLSSYCFGSCGFTGTLKIPSTIETITEQAFWGCSSFDNTLVIPEGVKVIERYAFGSFGTRGAEGTLTLPSTLTTIGDSAFSGDDGFAGALTIPNSVETIGEDAFQNCTGFTSLKLPENEKFTTISSGAFGGWMDSSIMGFTGELDIPDTVTSIGDEAFMGCRKLTGTLTIPSSVTSIGDSSFARCYGFTGLSLPNSLTTIGEKAFYLCEYLSGDLVIPDSVTTIGEDAFAQVGLKANPTGALVLGKSLKTIDDGAFWNCSTFNGALVIPESVTTIGREAFKNCSSFTSFNIPAGLTEIDYGVFSGCSGLAGALEIPTSVTSIGSYAFFGCTGLTGTLTIPEGVTEIGNYAFSQCAGFSDALVIPSNVETIGYNAFDDCTGFTGTLVIPESVTSLGSDAFSGCSGFTGLVMNQNYSNLESGVFGGCTGLTGGLTIPSQITTIGPYAFSGCTGLTGKLVIPATVTSISSYCPFYKTSFSEIENNSEGTFSAKSVASSTTDYYVDSEGTKVYTIETGTYTRVANADAVDMSTAVVTGVEDQVYTGYYLKPEPTVTVNGTVLTKNEHYTVSYKNNARVGTATVIITGVDYEGYTGTKEVNFKIIDTSSYIIIADQESVYTGKAQTYSGAVAKSHDAEVTFAYYSDSACTKAVSAANVKNVGTYYVKATLAADDTHGSSTSNVATFTITAASSSISLVAQNKAYTGGKLAYSGKVTKSGSTGKVTYAYYSNSACTKAVTAANVKKAGTYYVKATLAADANHKAATSRAVKFVIAKLTVTPAKASYAYTGKTIKPAVKVKFGSTTLTTASYTASYASGLKNVGTYKITVKLKGAYVGSGTTTFKILPKATTALAPKALKKGFTAKWKKQATQTTGYQVQYALNSKFTSAKTITVKGPKVVSKKVTKLKAKKKYWVRVRTYKTVGKTTYYSAWSGAKTVTTKK